MGAKSDILLYLGVFGVSWGRAGGPWSASVVSWTRLGVFLGCLGVVLEVSWARLGGSWRSFWHHFGHIFEVCYGMPFISRF